MLDDYYTIAQVAKELNEKPSTISARIRKGTISAEKKGWNIFIHVEELKRLKLDAANKDMGKSAG